MIVLGPFGEALIQKLASESPDKYKIYEEETVDARPEVIQRGISDGIFVDFKKENVLFKVTRTQTLHEIAMVRETSIV